MRKYLNTLFVTTQGAYLSKEGETVVVKIDGEKKLQLPIITLDGIACFGQVSMSPYLMAFCAEKNVAVSFLSEYGRYLASVYGKIKGNVLLRREQYRKADDLAFCAGMAKTMLSGKFVNCRTVLQRTLRDHKEKVGQDEIKSASRKIIENIGQLDKCGDLETLRGLEGDTAHAYFGVFDHLIVRQKKHFSFSERNRRPPLDKVNCLLSFIYTLIMHDIRSALETVGLDSYVGFLHRDRPGRAGLALDMMEEFRPFIGDRLVLSLINRRQVDNKGFKKSESGAVVMKDKTRKIVLEAYQNRKQEEIEHPYLKETVCVGILFYVQALLLARYLRGDIDGYPVFVWK
ncbi:MAG: type I-C CRISPR-associated endonuclease Cas1c [Candidatus Margulisiibacteriota bacterium]|nr:type I-C CRISPR-associated endonuclease Cas1c [Candidatus Margulisiibacteriota bacterium]